LICIGNSYFPIALELQEVIISKDRIIIVFFILNI